MAKMYLCVGCNKSYASSQSLWNHKQRCLRREPTEYVKELSKKNDEIDKSINMTYLPSTIGQHCKEEEQKEVSLEIL